MATKGFHGKIGSPDEIRAYMIVHNPAPVKPRVPTDPLSLMRDIRRLVDLIDTMEVRTHTDLGDLDDWLRNLRADLVADLDRLEDVR